MNTTELIDELRRVKVLLSEKDEGFASSLIKQWDKKAHLSDKQIYWVKKLSQDAVVQGDDGGPHSISIDNGKNLLGLFEKAGTKLKFPSISFSLNTSDGIMPVVVRRSGTKSQYTGQLNLTDGGPFGMSHYYGRVDLEGEYWPSKNPVVQQHLQTMICFLRDFAVDPHATAFEHGHKSGHCCFCNRKLTEEKSLAAGYGPVCAKNWGLAVEWKTAAKKEAS